MLRAPYHTSQAPRHARGYTLVEMLVVLVLLGFIMLISVRKLDSVLPQTRLRASAREFVSAVQAARDQSILVSGSCGFRVAMGRGEYWIVLPTRGEGRSFFVGTSEGVQEYGRESLSRQRLRTGVQFKSLYVAGEGQIASGTAAIGISPLGAFPDLVAHLENDRGSVVTVKINGVTGVASFHKGYQSYEELQPAFLPR